MNVRLSGKRKRGKAIVGGSRGSKTRMVGKRKRGKACDERSRNS